MMRRIFGTKLTSEKTQQPQSNQDFFGSFTLAETKNIQEFSCHAFANLFHKICFHTGFREREILQLLGKTLIQADLKMDGFTTMVWSIHIDKPLPEPPAKPQPESYVPPLFETPPSKGKKVPTKKTSTGKEPKPVQVFFVQEEPGQSDGGFIFSIKFKPGDEFLIAMPFTGEKVKSVIKRRTNAKTVEGVFYEQTIHLPNGIVEAVYSRTEKGGLKITLHHLQSRINAEVFFKKIFTE